MEPDGGRRLAQEVRAIIERAGTAGSHAEQVRSATGPTGRLGDGLTSEAEERFVAVDLT